MEQYTRYSDRLIYKVLSEKDLEEFYEVLKLDEVGKWLLTGRGKTKEEVLAKIHLYIKQFTELGYGTWGVFEKTTNKLIGQAGLMPTPEKYIGLIYSFHPEAWGKGYGTESCMLALSYGFNELKTNKITAFIKPENDKSSHVLEKCGLTKGGIEDYEGILMRRFEIDIKDWFK